MKISGKFTANKLQAWQRNITEVKLFVFSSRTFQAKLGRYKRGA